MSFFIFRLCYYCFLCDEYDLAKICPTIKKALEQLKKEERDGGTQI